MSDRKIKVWNRSKGHHDFICSDKKVVPIPAGGYAKITEDEIHYNNQLAKSFKKRILEIDPSEKELLEELGYENRNANAYSPEELTKLLSGTLTDKVKKELSEITERHAKDKLIDVARNMDLPFSKIQFIEDLTGMTVYNEFIKEEQKEQKSKKIK